MTLAGLAAEVTATAADEAVRRAALGELSSFAAAEDFIASAVADFFRSHGSEIAAKMEPYIRPMAEKAIEVIKPSMKQALEEYTPTFAAIVGGMFGLSVLLGSWIARREMRKGRRRRTA
jgi:hypothetical protein